MCFSVFSSKATRLVLSVYFFEIPFQKDYEDFQNVLKSKKSGLKIKKKLSYLKFCISK